MLVVVGEAPGEEEVREGIPFIGPSGRLLRGMMHQAGLRPSRCMFTNVVWCRPPGNLTPGKEAISHCTTYHLGPLLDKHRHLNWLLAGSVASQYILGEPITECAGYAFKNPQSEALIVPVLHPAALIRQPADIPSTVRFMEKVAGKAAQKPKTEEDFRINPPYWELAEFVAQARAGKFVVLDVETASFTDLRLTVIGLTADTGKTVTCSWNDRVEAIVRPLLEDTSVAKVAYNIKFDAKALRLNGIDLAGDWVDIMRLVQLDDIGTSRMSLEAVAPYYLNVESWKRKSDEEGLLLYNARDSYYEWCIYTKLVAKLFGSARWQLWARTCDLEKVVARMEEVGFSVDMLRLAEIRTRVVKEMEQAEAEWREVAGEVNPASPKQLVKLFEERGVQLWRTNEGKVSTEERYLRLTASKDKKAASLILPLLRLRKLRKLESTYLDYVPAGDGALHTSVKTTGTATGRFAFAEPNLGNIPKRDDFGIRSVFVARPGYLLVSSDWSQAEARITAILAKEERMLDAWRTGRDVHKVTASALFGVTEEEVTKDQRELAKRILYGLSYGAGYRKLAEHAEISFREAQVFIERFKAAFPSYFAQLQEWNSRADEYGYLVNPFGRVHTFSGDRTATQSRNFVPQSTVADMMNIVLCDLWWEMREKKMHSRILLQIYDQVIVEAKEEEVIEIREMLLRHMNRHWSELAGEQIPADVSSGLTWADV